MDRLFLGFVYVLMILCWILSGIMHLWTVYIAYSMFGIFMGIVSLFFPVISEIVMAFISWKDAGFSSPYIQWLIVLVLIWVAYYIFVIISASLETKTYKNQDSTYTENSHLKGIGGWLILVLLGMIGTLINIGISLKDSTNLFNPETWHVITTYGSAAYHPLFGTWVIYETTINAITAILIIGILVLMFKKSPFFPKLMIFYFISSVFLQGIDYYLSYTVLTALPKVSEILNVYPSIDGVTRSLVQAAVWIPYFMKSKRVKETFNSNTFKVDLNKNINQ